MKIRKIKPIEKANGMKYCTFCKPVKVDAIYRDNDMKLACETHKSLLTEEIPDDGYMSEGDYQSWGRL